MNTICIITLPILSLGSLGVLTRLTLITIRRVVWEDPGEGVGEGEEGNKGEGQIKKLWKSTCFGREKQNGSWK